jgi:hypothetical protein
MATSAAARSLLLGACAGSLLVLGSLTASRAIDTPQDGVRAAGSAKESPYAAAKDETVEPAATAGAGALKALGGTRPAGSSKDSPYAAAKDEDHDSLEPTTHNLWRLVLPLGLAAGSYLWLRSRDHLEKG